MSDERRQPKGMRFPEINWSSQIFQKRKVFGQNQPLKAANLRRRLGLKSDENAEYKGLPELINPFDKEKKKAIPGAGN